MTSNFENSTIHSLQHDAEVDADAKVKADAGRKTKSEADAKAATDTRTTTEQGKKKDEDIPTFQKMKNLTITTSKFTLPRRERLLPQP